MELVGTGFLARHLAAIGGRHPGVLLLAAGVPMPDNPPEAYAREANLVEWAADRCSERGDLLVFLSTAGAAVYGTPSSAGREDEPAVPADDYGRHKLGLERRVAALCARHLVLRLTYVVGPGGRPDRLVPALIRQLRTGTVTVYRGATRDLIDVSDLVRIVDGLLLAGIEGEVVNVASGWSVPVEQLVDLLEVRLGTRATRRYVDVELPHRVSTEKLCRLLPAVQEMSFGPDYPRVVLDRYLTAEGHAGRVRSTLGGLASGPSLGCSGRRQ